jgi:hypothetical protein
MSDGVGAAAPNAASYYERWKHHDVGTLIRICDDYIVYIDKKGKLDWEINMSVDELSDTDKNALTAVYCDIVVHESASLDGYSPEHKERYLTILGEAYVHWITQDPVTARRLVTAAQQYYRERSEETSRSWYLNCATRVSCMFLIAGALAWVGKAGVIAFIGITGFKLGIAAVAGSSGALFSVIARTGKLNFKASAGRGLHELEAASRICTGAISGVVVYLAFTSELILGELLKNVHRTEIALLASIAAGAAERLTSSIISRFDESKMVATTNPSEEKVTKEE